MAGCLGGWLVIIFAYVCLLLTPTIDTQVNTSPHIPSSSASHTHCHASTLYTQVKEELLQSSSLTNGRGEGVGGCKLVEIRVELLFLLPNTADLDLDLGLQSPYISLVIYLFRKCHYYHYCITIYLNYT